MKYSFNFGILATVSALVFTTPAFAEDVTFMIDWLPSGDKAVAYYGVEKGFFKDAGLDVTIQSGRGSSDVVTKLATGAADMGTAGLSSLMQAKAESGAPVSAVASLYTIQPDVIFTTKDSGIKTLKDLEGKKIATATFSSSNVVWPVLLKENGVDADSITVLKVDPGALAPMMAMGQVDGTINWLTKAPAFDGPLNEVGKELDTIAWSDAGYDGYGLSLLASDAFIAKNPETVRKFVQAFLAAQAAAVNDPAGAAEAVKKMVPEVELDATQAQWASSIPLIVNDISAKDGMGTFAPTLLGATWNWVAMSEGLDPTKFNPETAVNTSFLK